LIGLWLRRPAYVSAGRLGPASGGGGKRPRPLFAGSGVAGRMECAPTIAGAKGGLIADD